MCYTLRFSHAETLNFTHKVDDKVTELIDGEQMRSSGFLRIPEHGRLDVKEVKAVILRSANIADEEKR